MPYFAEVQMMATLVTDPNLEDRIRAQRAEWGGDRYDEVWEGVYIMTPFPNYEHLDIAAEFTTILRAILRPGGLRKRISGRQCERPRRGAAT